ncbi:SGNH/GDSL hydrolase family protein [Leekyejoonella antrihumi]|uniref:SGNH/GDSL hydrolase family protein n=1 Tax=Leekyejoonella antrihumi TaxID=1660198 RepID=A0A563DVU1_9MICO|nr:SGNH/GDSL hydrolase family protein [Leekyejoonella antrihumi]TWP33844.1 SGNH/GDSL hydrolase family protein [Leekyejoonella antrihumi]
MHRLRSALVALLALVMAVIVAAPAQAASPASYVALGDSYSSGVGAGGSYSGGSCDRSNNAYAALWAAAHPSAAFLSVACSGASTSSVLSSQVPSLSASTTLVSLTVGGNDVGFAADMSTCVLKGTSACVSAVQAAENTATSVLPGRLASLFAAIHSAAPSAKVVVLDYPVFYKLGVWYCIGLSSTSRAKIDQGINLLDGVLRESAAKAGVTFVDVRSAFVGHQICSSSSWLHSVDFFDLSESYHPTSTGQSSGYLRAFSTAVG